MAKNNNTTILIITIILVIILGSGFGMMGFGGYGMGGMMNWMYGTNYGFAWIFGIIMWIIVATTFVLLIMWLIKQLQNSRN